MFNTFTFFLKDPSKYGNWIDLKWDRPDFETGNLNVTVLLGNRKVLKNTIFFDDGRILEFRFSLRSTGRRMRKFAAASE